MSVTDWLLESDPAIRWQVLRDLTDAPPFEVASERARVATEGWGARLLDLQGADGRWGGGTYVPLWTATTWTLLLFRDFGLDPDSRRARAAVDLVAANSRWEHDGEPFFDGEVEPCVNGAAVAIGAYLHRDVQSIVDRLLGEQMADGGWNCDQEHGSTRGAFASTLDVLDGLLEHERSAAAPSDVTAARLRGEAYLVERGLLRRKSTGALIDAAWTHFSYPPRYHYDVLRALDYLRAASAPPDDRLAEALDILEQRRRPDGRWPLERPHEGQVFFDLDEVEGQPSRWNTLRAMRVLRWAGRA